MRLLRYVELKSGSNGPAWIGYVTLSKSKATLYFNGRALQKVNGISGNHLDLETHEEFWVSGVKKNGQDRHFAAPGKILVEAAALEDYLSLRGLSKLNSATHAITNEIVATPIEHFNKLENSSYRNHPAENEDV